MSVRAHAMGHLHPEAKVYIFLMKLIKAFFRGLGPSAEIYQPCMFLFAFKHISALILGWVNLSNLKVFLGQNVFGGAAFS